MKKKQQKKELLANITNCAKELLDYCNGILDYSKNELGSLPILARKFNIRSVVGSVFTIESPPAKLKNLKLELDFDPDIPQILVGDSYRLNRILINLVSNAIKFTEEGKIKLTVKLAKQPDKRTMIILFIVADTGMGIPAEKTRFYLRKIHPYNTLQ